MTMRRLNMYFIFIVFSLAITSPAKSGPLSTEKTVRKGGLHRQLTMWVDGGPETGNYSHFINAPNPGVSQSRQELIPYGPICISYHQGVIPAVQGTRTKEK